MQYEGNRQIYHCYKFSSILISGNILEEGKYKNNLFFYYPLYDEVLKHNRE